MGRCPARRGERTSRADTERGFEISDREVELVLSAKHEAAAEGKEGIRMREVSALDRPSEVLDRPIEIVALGGL